MKHTNHTRTFDALHDEGFLLPNAWDAASARVFEQAGFPAIGTTSAGIAYSRGLRDGQHMTLDDMLREVRVITAAVNVPVNADIEAGYGDEPAAVARAVTAFAALGVVGVNLEDATGQENAPLYDLHDQQRRIDAARRAADASGTRVFLNARTDTYLASVGRDAQERFDETVRRGRAYLNAGADAMFVPLATDPATLRALRAEIGGRITVMAFPGAPRVSEMLSAGVSRVSIGQGAMLAALGSTARVARELRTDGTYASMQATFYGFQEAHDLFAPHTPVEACVTSLGVNDYPVASQRRT